MIVKMQIFGNFYLILKILSPVYHLCQFIIILSNRDKIFRI